jgi:hypothetical protein
MFSATSRSVIAVPVFFLRSAPAAVDRSPRWLLDAKPSDSSHYHIPSLISAILVHGFKLLYRADRRLSVGSLVKHHLNGELFSREMISA